MDWVINTKELYNEEIKKLKKELENVRLEKDEAVRERENLAKQFEETKSCLLREKDQLLCEIHDIRQKYNEAKHLAVPKWLDNEAMIKHKIKLMPHQGELYLLKKEPIVIKTIMFCKCDRIFKLPKEYKLPSKLHIGLHIVDNKVVGSGLFYKHRKLYRYHFAHAYDYICASFPSEIASLEDYLRAIKFILISFETLNLSSAFELRSRDSFKRIFENILKEAASIAPEESLGDNGLPLVNNCTYELEDR